jgi:hypothetical protein
MKGEAVTLLVSDQRVTQEVVATWPSLLYGNTVSVGILAVVGANNKKKGKGKVEGKKRKKERGKRRRKKNENEKVEKEEGDSNKCRTSIDFRYPLISHVD